MTQRNTTFELSIKSDTKNIRQVEKFFRSLNKNYFHLHKDKFFSLLLAVSEAVNNGIIHGNKNDHGKKVFITCSLKNKTLTTTVKDEGDGFQPKNIPNPTMEENIFKIGGRGVFLIKSYMNGVRFNKKGNAITMKMRLE